MGRAEDLFKKIEDEGEAAIDELIATRKSEELFLDFKRSSNNGSAQRLSDTDRNNFAKAISGFGNSEGGVIVWGVDCSRDAVGADVARFRVPITDAARYTSWLEGVVSCPVSELSTPKWTKVEATFSCGLSQLRLTYLFTISV